MSQNKEDLKNKIIYRATYRGTKEMDILMIGYVKSIINDINYEQMLDLDKIVNLSDENLVSLKKKEINIDIKNSFILKKFQEY
jgi:antitoxin CptB|tara:strand:- start:49 stop:297 length:249 start_codon:yes stop_codon:yes gene_type:complete